MTAQVRKNGDKVSYAVRRSKRAKRMRIAVHCDCSVVVTSPYTLSEQVIKKFVKLKFDWIAKKMAFFSGLDINKDIAVWSKEHYEKHKADALRVISKRVDFFAAKTGLEPNGIKVKMLKTKWGSCSVKRNLNFNYKVLFLDSNLRDYIIVHELCHLKHMNHSKKFWRYVEKVCPDYRDLMEDLKKSGI